MKRDKGNARQMAALSAAYEVVTDVVQGNAVAIAVMTGHISLEQALRATGLDRAQWDELVAESAALGREYVRQALLHGWTMEEAWRQNIVTAQAFAEPGHTVWTGRRS